MITLKESILNDTKSKIKNVSNDIRKPEMHWMYNVITLKM